MAENLPPTPRPIPGDRGLFLRVERTLQQPFHECAELHDALKQTVFLSFDAVRAVHVIEHVSDVIRAMEEFHRILRPGGRLLIVTPHYTDFSSFCDPTHRWHLNSFSFRYFGEDHAGFGYYTAKRFREISVRVKLLALWRWLGFEYLVNRFPRYRRFWEYYLCYVVRGKVMDFEFEVIK